MIACGADTSRSLETGWLDSTQQKRDNMTKATRRTGIVSLVICATLCLYKPSTAYYMFVLPLIGLMFGVAGTVLILFWIFEDMIGK